MKVDSQIFVRLLFLIFVVNGFFIPASSRGATFCVSNEIELQTALTTAASNGEDDTVQIVQGTYNGNFTYASTEANSLTIEGGYTEGCASRLIEPANTILDGGGADNVLALVRQTGAADFSVEGLTLRNGNAATAENGGGLYAKTEGNVALLDNIFTGNTAQKGGGGAYVSGTATLTNNTFTGNSASYNGGGVYIRDSGTFTNNTFTGNSSSGEGGGVSGSGTFTDNAFTENSAFRGGGVSGSGTFTNNTFTGNSASSGGGVSGGRTFTNNTFTGNSTFYFGGGVYGSSGTFTNNTFTGNSASYNGGGVYIWDSGTFTNNTFTGNSSYSGSGGGVLVGSSGTFTNNTFTGNSAFYFGGGVRISDSGTFTNNTFTGNSASSGGGGVRISDSGTFTNNTFTGNSSSGEGGGVYGSSGTFTNNTFTGNSSSGEGGGVYGSSGTFTNNTFTGNSASRGGGIALTLDKSEYTGNIYNNIIWNNTASEAADIYIDNTGDDPFFPAAVNLFNNDFDQSTSGTVLVKPFAIDPSNLNNADPLFVSADNYHLSSSSPCINTGDNNAPSIPATDKDGNPRISQDVVDMGAYEYNSSAPIANAGPDQTVISCVTVTLDGSASSDPGSQTLTYLWTQTAGNVVNLSDATAVDPTFVAGGTSVSFRLMVTNTSGLKNSDSVNITSTYAPTLYVKEDGDCGGKCPCFALIQAAIEAAGPGAVIRIAQGTYNEATILNVEKSLTLQGGWDSTFSAQTPNTTFIKAPSVPKGSLTLQMVTVKPR